ncbi:MAG: AAA family ATPase [Bacteroidales bacterium]|nr:AAA family ATPase [Bacteroidales bacterium]
MTTLLPHIAHVAIDRLWPDHGSISWQLHPAINILSGVNGMGKSTIINAIVRGLELGIDEAHQQGIHLTLMPQGSTSIPFDVIRSFDRPALSGDVLRKLAGTTAATELDMQLFLLQRRYLDYQVNLGNRMIELLTCGSETSRAEATEVAQVKLRFQDLVDDLFSETGKQVDRTLNEMVFLQKGEHLRPYQLSSGEKQMLVILLTVLTQDQRPCVLLMDEPEVSLHIEWQQRLVDLIRQLNPNAQIILTTHSPALIMDGWLDAVTDVADILTD